MLATIQRQRQVLNDQEIFRFAPSVFATQPHEQVSDRYSFIPTSSILDTLRKEGWQCVQAGENNVRKQSKVGFQKHMLRFNNPNLPLIGDSQIDLVIYNSHDRTTGFQFKAGLYRFVCANGLAVGENLVQPISVKHIGRNGNEAIEASYRIVENVPQISEAVQGMHDLVLNQDERLAFAESALVAKYGNERTGSTDILPSSILRARRNEDQDLNLWTTFNVVQENLIKGGQRTVNANRTRRITTRGVNSLSENAKLNSALWTLAESMKTLKTGAAS